jgi:hypothetical protein
MNKEVKYGVMATKTEEVTEMLTLNLGLTFNGRESGYWGEYFIYRDSDDIEIRIYENKDPMWRAELDIPEEEFFEYEYRTFKVLILATVPSDLQIKLLNLLQQHFPSTVQIDGKANA